MKLLYDNKVVADVMTNHSMSIEELLTFTDIDINEERNGDLVWDYSLFKIATDDQLISIADYAALNNVTPQAIKKKCQRDGFLTARKLGRDWLIDQREEYKDQRIKSGKYINWREKSE